MSAFVLLLEVKQTKRLQLSVPIYEYTAYSLTWEQA
jgi:hypothetical protein